MACTSHDNYWEDFAVGTRYEHARGRTVSNEDNLAITHQTLNTAQAHFNLDFLSGLMDGAFEERLVMGAVNLAIIIGLTTEDMSENAIADVGMTEIRLTNPVYREDTLYASSEVVDVRESTREDAGLMTYRFTGRKADGTEVATGLRTVMLKKRSHWAEADGNAAGGELDAISA
ncbi:MaoC family dehydratase [Amycolatopsis thermophila]|uniref:Acyl dehydratase n=1 Tax=Amycolatopsis thermophila TaxID=206084 RepID=A0ABU0F5U3_9PSEU|nr:MaoC family dehydratase [Amycolatopsis thermophila]MDQ0382491.1 acyl dehydratase [Amycolatopsis thermophila]